MSFKYPKNVIVVFSVVAALLAATVLLGGYANSKPADTQAPAKACQASGCCCPGENAEGCCDNPCPIPCPKPCCAEEGCCGSTGCPMAAAETATQ